MMLILLLPFMGMVLGEPDDIYCCGSGRLVDDTNHCLDINSNDTTPTVLTCSNDTQSAILGLNFTIRDDGVLVFLAGGMDVELEKGSYCIANETLIYSERVFFVCSEVEEDILDQSVLGYCLVVSSVFLAVTTIVYCALPELRDLQGKSIINFCISLAFGSGILGMMKLMEYSHMGLCAARGFFTYFFYLSSFFWTNAISLQIYFSIRRPIVSDYGWKAFFVYALYAWGVPAILTISMAIVNFHPGNHPKPGIGLNTCWFFGSQMQWYWMYSVMTLLILVNICIFSYISLHLWRQTFCSSHTKALKYKFVMSVRMFTLMGLPWIFEMISSLSPPHVIWVITDIFNVSQGIIIFLLLVVFRRRVVKAMARRGWLDCVSGAVERHLAVGDDEEEIVEHTTAVVLDDRPNHINTK